MILMTKQGLKKFLLITTMLIVGFFSIDAFASVEQEKVYLTQIINQLDAMQPLIIAAQKEQPVNMRIQFHYTKYKDTQGTIHNGLLEDVQAMRKGIEEKLNNITIEPRAVSPIKGDYIEAEKIEKIERIIKQIKKTKEEESGKNDGVNFS